MNRNRISQYDIAQRQLRNQVPEGAQWGALSGQAQDTPFVPYQGQVGMPVHPAMAGNPYAAMASNPMAVAAFQQGIPQGAEAALLAGCGNPYPGGYPYAAVGAYPDGCYPAALGTSTPPFPVLGPPTPWKQCVALLGVRVANITDPVVTLEVCCEGFFRGIGARWFGECNQWLLSGLSTSLSSIDLLCRGGAVDMCYFDTTDCYCPFDFGCFSCAFPLLMTFEAADPGASEQPPLSFVIVGDRVNFPGVCWPYFPTPGFPVNGGFPTNGIPSGPNGMLAPPMNGGTAFPVP